jgi:hypothetical protein
MPQFFIGRRRSVFMYCALGQTIEAGGNMATIMKGLEDLAIWRRNAPLLELQASETVVMADIVYLI